MHIEKIIFTWIILLIVIVCGLISSGIISIQIEIVEKDKTDQNKNKKDDYDEENENK